MSYGRPINPLYPLRGDEDFYQYRQSAMRSSRGFDASPFWSMLFWSSFFSLLLAISPQAFAQPLRDLPGWDLRTGFDTSGVEGPADYREPDWSAWVATQMGLDPQAVCEIHTRSGKRVDILTREESIEVEHATKWYESIGQALFYAIETGREPAVLLLVKQGDERDAREVLLCQSVCARVGVRLYVQQVPKPELNRLEPPKTPMDETSYAPRGVETRDARFRGVSAA